MFKDGILKVKFDTDKDLVRGTHATNGSINWYKLFGSELVMCIESSKNICNCFAEILVLVIDLS